MTENQEFDAGKVVFSPHGEWNPISYELLCQVTYKGSSYWNDEPTTAADMPGVSPKWHLLAKKGDSFKYEDFTQEQLREIKQPIVDAAAEGKENFAEQIARQDAAFATKQQQNQDAFEQQQSSNHTTFEKSQTAKQISFDNAEALRQQIFNTNETARREEYEALKQQLTSAYNTTTKNLEDDFKAKTADITKALTDAEGRLSADYQAKYNALVQDYNNTMQALYTAYNEAISGLNSRMSAVESQYITDKALWEKDVADFIIASQATFNGNLADWQKAVEDAIAAIPTDIVHEAPADGELYARNGLTKTWEKVADKQLATTVNILDRAISPYSKQLHLPLTHNLATGSILAMEGDMVVLKAQEGWGITRIDREEFHNLGLASGDTLLLPMAHFDAEGKPVDNLMLVGAVLFAAEEAVKGQSGEVLYQRRTSLFRATDNAIATWGGVKKWLAIADNESLLICHPLDITEATITRNGNDAANAAADLNQRRRIEEKLNLGGKDPRAWVGMADQLAPSEKTEQAAYRDEVLPAGRILGFAPELGPDGAGTRDGQISDAVSPVMREVAGVSCGSGQMVKNPTFSKPDGTFSSANWHDGYSRALVDNGDGTVSKPAEAGSFRTSISIVTGHKNLVLFSGIGKDNQSHSVFGFRKGTTITNVISTITSQSMKNYGFIASTNVESDVIYIDSFVKVSRNGVVFLDLTTLHQLPQTFVASLTSTDAHRVAHALGFLALQRD